MLVKTAGEAIGLKEAMYIFFPGFVAVSGRGGGGGGREEGRKGKVDSVEGEKGRGREGKVEGKKGRGRKGKREGEKGR